MTTLTRRNPRIVSFFRPYEEFDLVTLGEKDWILRQDVHGWYITDTGDYRGMHHKIQKVKSMIDLIGMIERLYFSLQTELAPA